MTVFRVPKHSNFTVMSNHHLQNKEISLKAKGLMSLMLSLPDNWDYTQAGLAAICRDGVDSIRAAVNELEENGYLKRRRMRDAQGRYEQVEYAILEKPEGVEATREKPVLEKPILENPILEKPTQENPISGKPIQEKPTQLNTNQLNTKRLNTKKSNTNPSIKDGRDAEGNAIENSVAVLDAESEKERRIAYEKVLKSNIEYDVLVFDRPHEKGRIDELLLIMLDFLFYRKEQVEIGDLSVPTEIVRKRFFLLNRSHIEYVLHKLSENRTEIRNIRKYLFSTLYYAPSTIESYYAAKVSHDQP